MALLEAPSNDQYTTALVDTLTDMAYLTIVVDGDNLRSTCTELGRELNFPALVHWIYGYYRQHFAAYGRPLRLTGIDFFLTINSLPRLKMANELAARGVDIHPYPRRTGDPGYSDSEIMDELRLHGVYHDAVCLISSDSDFWAYSRELWVPARQLRRMGVRVGSIASEVNLGYLRGWRNSFSDGFLLEELAEGVPWLLTPIIRHHHRTSTAIAKKHQRAWS